MFGATRFRSLTAAFAAIVTLTTLSTAYGVRNADGYNPRYGIVVSGTTIFGMAFDGGANGDGTIWSFDIGTDTFAKLHDFNRVTDGRGAGGLAMSDTKLLGTAGDGGADDAGTIWSFDTSTDTFTKLHDFNRVSDGRGAAVGLALSGTTLFGTAGGGGANNMGTIWSFETSADTFTKLHDFRAATDGQGSGGVALLGTTVFGSSETGGANGNGTFWSFDTSADTFTKIHDASSVADGRQQGGVVVSGSTVIGGRSLGGVNGDGTIWSYDTSTETFAKLHDFSSANHGSHPSDVAAVYGTKVFGTAETGGANSAGTIWSYDISTQTFAKLHDFDSVLDGESPQSGVAVSGTTVFGTASSGGAHGAGTIWSYDTSNATFTKLHDFSPIPEPSSVALVTIGASFAVMFRRSLVGFINHE